VPELPAADLAEVIAKTESLWQELRGGRLFLTGGTGFIGSWLLESFARADELLSLHARTVVLTRDPSAFLRKSAHLARNRAIEFHRGDVRTFDFPAGEFSHVIHAAGDSSRRNADPLLVFDTITGGTQRVLEFCQLRGARKLLFLSSGAVYGRQPAAQTHIDERYLGAPPLEEPRFAYGHAKRAAEFLCQASATVGLHIVIPRCFAVLGPNLPLDGPFAAGNFVRDVLEGRPITVRGDGTAVRSYLYAADLTIWLWTLLFRGRSGLVINTGSDQAITIRELAHLAASLCPNACTVQIDGAPVGGEPERYVPCIQKAREELSLEVSTPVLEALRRTLVWYQRDQSLFSGVGGSSHEFKA
jgi:dTDP-glucose 4,6-dehydratase